MEDLFDPTTGERFRRRIQSVSAESVRQWGTLSAAQMLEHCARGLEMATGERQLAPNVPSRLLGAIIKPFLLREGVPMRRGAPTVSALLAEPETDLEGARAHLLEVYDRFCGRGAAGCGDRSHPFFGRLVPSQWSMLMYKHLDHHLRQFSA